MLNSERSSSDSFWQCFVLALVIGIFVAAFLIGTARGEDPVRRDELVTIDEAVAILGREKIATPEDVGKVFGSKMEDLLNQQFGGKLIPYNRDVLERCRDENRKERDWRLVVWTAAPPEPMILVRGTDPDNPPCFFIEKELNGWIMKSEESDWMMKTDYTSWQLVDMKPRFQGLSWTRQEEEIRKLGMGYARAPLALVSETLLDFYVSRKERLLSHGARDAHWSEAKTSSGAYVRVWFFMDKAVSFWQLDPKEETLEGPGVCVTLR